MAMAMHDKDTNQDNRSPIRAAFHKRPLKLQWRVFEDSKEAECSQSVSQSVEENKG